MQTKVTYTDSPMPTEQTIAAWKAKEKELLSAIDAKEAQARQQLLLADKLACKQEAATLREQLRQHRLHIFDLGGA